MVWEMGADITPSLALPNIAPITTAEQPERTEPRILEDAFRMRQEATQAKQKQQRKQEKKMAQRERREPETSRACG